MEKSDRPFSAHTLINNITKTNNQKIFTNDTNFKERINPTKLSSFYTKEDLNQIINSLKDQINELTKENKALKIKIIKTEKKKSIPYTLNPKTTSNYINNEEKNRMILKLSEFESENKALKANIERLNQTIDKITKNLPPDYKKIYDKYLIKCNKIKILKNQLQKYVNFKSAASENDKQLSNAYSKQLKINEIGSNRQKIRMKVDDASLHKGIIEKIFTFLCINKLENDEI